MYTMQEIQDIQNNAYIKFSRKVCLEIKNAAELGEAEITIENVGRQFQHKILNELKNNGFGCYIHNNKLKITWYS